MSSTELPTRKNGQPVAGGAAGRWTASGGNTPLPDVIGTGPAMDEVVRLVRLAAPSRATVLIVGETGTGKELIARAIWQLSDRPQGPYVRVNCGALHENLLESELFGHVKGAFTGAVEHRIGRFEAAHGGTIFLDEVNSMSPALQVKLLRVLQEGTFERVGDTRAQRVDVRVIAASNELLGPKMAAGQFRPDLYYRLNVVPIFLPPLRARREDIGPLARFFLDRYGRENGIRPPDLTPELLRELQTAEWPGNVRELENVVERLVVLGRGGPVPSGVVRLDEPRFPFRGQAESADDLPGLLRRAVRRAVEAEAQPGSLFDHFIQAAERELLAYVLTLSDGVQTKAARLLGINRNTLAKKLGEAAGPDRDPDWVI